MFSSPFGRPFRPPFGPRNAVGGVVLILDQFTDADSTSLDAHTIAPTNTPATAWTEQTGNWQITGNQACVAVAALNGLATCNPGVADCALSASVKVTAGATTSRDAGIAARYSNTSNYWTIGINATDGAFRITERNGGTDSVRATVSLTISASAEYTIAVTLSGATISATLDGANPISYASATLNQTSTIHGIRARATTDRVDNFRVVTL